MVMHARKLPRLNDGYNGRGQGHHYEEKGSGKGRSSSFNEKFSEKGSPSYSRHRDASPSSRSSPRYQNKSSYIERERSRLSRVQSNSPGDKRGSYSGASSSSHTNHSSSSKEGRNGRDHKDIQKSAIRVCGDWSEHISSSGKKYYYNFKLEVSQWEKPKDWAPENAKTNSSRSKDQRSGSSKSGDDRHKHSQSNAVGSSRHMERSSSSSHPSSSSSSMVLDNKYKQSPYPRQSQWHSGPDRTRTSTNDTTATPERSKTDRHTGDGGSRDRYNRGIHDGAITPVNRYTPSSTVTSASVNSNEHRSRYRDSRRINSHNDDSRHGDDMDISPNSTPTEESLGHRNKHHSSSSSHPAPTSTPSSIPTSTPTSSVIGAVAALPQLISQLSENDKSQQRLANQEFTQTAIQTLQKLQEALIAQQRQQQHQLAQLLQQQLQQAQINQQQSSSTSQPTTSTATHTTTTTTSTSSHGHQQNGGQSPAESEGTPLQSPDLNLPEPEYKRLQSCSEETSSQEGTGQDPRGHASPAQSQPPGAQSISVGGSQLAAAHKKPDTIQLPPSLANYCNEKLIDHVQGWNVAPLETQADRFAEEAHLVGSIHCTQLTVDLKKARSLVRLAEIRSTLQEQRVLFLRQQIKDLENMRSQNTFMPDT